MLCTTCSSMTVGDCNCKRVSDIRWQNKRLSSQLSAGIYSQFRHDKDSSHAQGDTRTVA